MHVTPWPFFAELDHEIVIDYEGLFSNNCFCFERIIWLYWMVWCLFLFALIFLTHTLMHALNLLKLSTSSHNESAYNSVFNCKFKRSFELKPNQILPLGIWLQPELQAVGFKKKDVLHCSVPSTPPWLLKRPQIDFSCTLLAKNLPLRKYFAQNIMRYVISIKTTANSIQMDLWVVIK